MPAAPSHHAPSRPLSQRFYARDARTVARALLGHTLAHHPPGSPRAAGRIVETEAYLGPEDLASHAAGTRRTKRNASMWACPGTAYVYMSHGLHACFNIATLRDDHPAAVLIRAIEPTTDLAPLRTRRPKARRDLDLTNGPGKLSQALAITIDHDGLDLADPASPLRIERGRGVTDAQIVTTARIGLGRGARDWGAAPLRFRVAGSSWAGRDPRVNPRWPNGFEPGTGV